MNRVSQRFVCSECGAIQWVEVAPRDTAQSIGYRCTDCAGVTEHLPEGVTDWYSSVS